MPPVIPPPARTRAVLPFSRLATGPALARGTSSHTSRNTDALLLPDPARRRPGGDRGRGRSPPGGATAGPARRDGLGRRPRRAAAQRAAGDGFAAAGRRRRGGGEESPPGAAVGGDDGALAAAGSGARALADSLHRVGRPPLPARPGGEERLSGQPARAMGGDLPGGGDAGGPAHRARGG